MVTITPIMVSTTTNIGFKVAYALNTQSIEGEQNTSQDQTINFSPNSLSIQNAKNDIQNLGAGKDSNVNHKVNSNQDIQQEQFDINSSSSNNNQQTVNQIHNRAFGDEIRSTNPNRQSSCSFKTK